MKQQVKISTYSIVINIIALIVIGAVMLINLNRGNMWFVWTLAGLLLIIFRQHCFICRCLYRSMTVSCASTGRLKSKA